jgi:hypothetical protein
MPPKKKVYMFPLHARLKMTVEGTGEECNTEIIKQ